MVAPAAVPITASQRREDHDCSTRITTPFTAESTAAEVVDGIDLTGRRAIVTGGASGIGVETARALAGAGAEVTLAVRNLEAGRARRPTTSSRPPATSRSSSRRSTSPTRPRSPRSSPAWDGPLHILVNNAGVMASPLTRTPEGWELQFATNHLGHFALATGLHGALAAAGGARIVVGQLERAPALAGRLRRHPLRATAPYEPWAAYGQSKTANVLFAVEATEALGRRRHHRQRADARAASGPTCSATSPTRTSTGMRAGRRRRGADVEDARAGRGHVGAASRRRRCSTASAAATSRTATRPSRTSPARATRRRRVRARPRHAARLWQVSDETLA